MNIIFTIIKTIADVMEAPKIHPGLLIAIKAVMKNAGAIIA